ncbi:hypothetical protein EBZ37_13460, partial [bacterium]|nr:hypothetical protein [bacterium]
SFEAVAFDSALNLGRLISAESRGLAVDRSKLAVAIRQIRDVPSVTGKISVSNGVWIRELRPLTIRDSEVVEWTPNSSGSHGKAATSAD